ncbi:MAG: flagellar biosynthetic protein FliR, partial [Thermoguttaceae bacterium]|nr:flagellar biosynthetic protein FliR [Thermoguttaceae bacterium]
LEKIIDLLSASVTSALGLALRLAFPLMLTSFTVWLAAGLLARSIPQLGMMPIGFSANTLLSLALMSLTIASVFALFGQKITRAFDILRLFGGG